MSRLERTMTTAGLAVAWLLPVGRRDWIVAVWAEAHGGYAAILALIPARAVVGPYPLTVPQRGLDLRVFVASGNSTHGMPGTSAGGAPWPGEIFFPVLTAC
jgi:hypothetical protein